MAGGKGTRMESETEKLLLTYKKPIILHVIDALQESKCFSKIIAVTSQNSPKTKELLLEKKIETIETKGINYVHDLNQILCNLDDAVFVTSGDLPFLDSEIVKTIAKMYSSDTIWKSIVVTKDFLDSLHLKSDVQVFHQGQNCYFSGISLVNATNITNLDSVKEKYEILDDKRVAFNLNTKQDYELLGIS